MHTALDISELIGHIIHFVDMLDDVAACALVARKWVYPAESRLFSEIRITGTAFECARQLLRLLGVFEQPPHLPTFVDSLNIQSLQDTQPADFERLSNIAFPNLTKLVLICLGNPEADQILPSLRRMASVPTLTSVVMMQYSFKEPAAYLDLWQNCSKNIRHLQLIHHPAYSRSQLTQSHAPSTKHGRIVLESIGGLGYLLEWLDDPRCPFDVSKLRVIQCSSLPGLLSPSLLEAAQNTVQILAIYALMESIDLSPFTQLTELHFSFLDSISLSLAMIATIPLPTRQRIRALQLDLIDPRTGYLERLGERVREITALLPGLRKVVMITYVRTPELTKDAEEYLTFGPHVEVHWGFIMSRVESFYVPIHVD